MQGESREKWIERWRKITINLFVSEFYALCTRRTQWPDSRRMGHGTPTTACAKLLTSTGNPVGGSFFSVLFVSIFQVRSALAGLAWLLAACECCDAFSKTLSENFWIFITVFAVRSATDIVHLRQTGSAAATHCFQLQTPTLHSHSHAACEQIVFEVHEPKNYRKHFCYIWLINCDR